NSRPSDWSCQKFPARLSRSSKVYISTLHFSCKLEAKSNGISSTASLPRPFTIRHGGGNMQKRHALSLQQEVIETMAFVLCSAVVSFTRLHCAEPPAVTSGS